MHSTWRAWPRRAIFVHHFRHSTADADVDFVENHRESASTREHYRNAG
jgi:hypothetical protein